MIDWIVRQITKFRELEAQVDKEIEYSRRPPRGSTSTYNVSYTFVCPRCKVAPVFEWGRDPNGVYVGIWKCGCRKSRGTDAGPR
jgi:hypothetical protein